MTSHPGRETRAPEDVTVLGVAALTSIATPAAVRSVDPEGLTPGRRVIVGGVTLGSRRAARWTVRRSMTHPGSDPVAFRAAVRN
jgi:hypothetical protein